MGHRRSIGAFLALSGLLLAFLTSSVARAATLRPAGAAPAAGYELTGTDGSVYSFGAAAYGSPAGHPLTQPVVGMAPTPDGHGYWLVAADGGVFNYGDAGFFGSAGNLKLTKPVVGIAPTADGKGYWLVAADGGIFNYGDAYFYGSAGNLKLVKPVVGMAADPTGTGYWMVAADGGIFNYGTAPFRGSAGNLRLVKPVDGMAPTGDGNGYWMVAADGGIFNYGTAAFEGSAGNLTLTRPVVGMAASPSGKGYWLVAADGGIFNYGDAPFEGSAGGRSLAGPVVGMAATSYTAPIGVTTTSLPAATDNAAYPSTTLIGTGGIGPYRWAASGLPPGLTLSYNGGVLSGTPTSPGTFNVLVGIGDTTTTTASRAFTLTINAPLSITTTSVPTAVAGQALAPTPLTATGGTGALTWSATGLPAGLTLSSAGSLSGTPTSSGATSVTVTVRDSLGAGTTAVVEVRVSQSFEAAGAVPAVATSFSSLTCPTVSTCYGAAGNSLAASEDGGQTWSTLPIPDGDRAYAISCPTADDCTAVGVNDQQAGVGAPIALSTTDGGSTWTTTLLPGALGTFPDNISCPSASTCTVVGHTPTYAGLALTEQQGTWSVGELPASTYQLQDLVCPAASHCVATGTEVQTVPMEGPGPSQVVVSDDGGRTWSTDALPSGVYFGPIGCSSATTCLSAGGAEASTDGGRTWAAQPALATFTVYAITCRPDGECLLAGPNSSITLTDNGRTVLASPKGSLNGPVSAACPTDDHCVLSGPVPYVSLDGGATWTGHASPDGVTELGPIACGDPQHCYAVGIDADLETATLFASADGGRTWPSQTVTTSFVGTPRELTCPAIGTCYAFTALGSGELTRTTDGGATWASLSAPIISQEAEGGTAVTTDVRCSTATDCMAFGYRSFTTHTVYASAHTTDGGASWSQSDLPPGPAQVSGPTEISCGSSLSCVEAHQAENFTTGSNGLTTVSDTDAILTTDDAGATWTYQTPPADPDNADLYSGLSCPTSMVCELDGHFVDHQELLRSTDGGQTWSVQYSNSSSGYSSVTCGSPSNCAAYSVPPDNSAPTILTTSDSGTTWIPAELPADITVPLSMTCTPSACLAIGGGGPENGLAFLYSPAGSG